MNVDVFYDEEEMKHHVIHNGKRLYYPRDYRVNRIIDLYRQVRYEQDARSPHFYWNPLNKPALGDIFVDVGAAEGLVALDYIEDMNKVYIIECEERWIDALRATFKPYKEKAIIIPALCGEHVESGKVITLDYLLSYETSPIVIKIDIEGAELKALRGVYSLITDTHFYHLHRFKFCVSSKSDIKFVDSYKWAEPDFWFYPFLYDTKISAFEILFIVVPSERIMWFT